MSCSTCASIRLGAPPRSWVRSTTPAASLLRAQRGTDCDRSSQRCDWLGDRRRRQDQLPDDRPWRLLPGPGQLHARRQGTSTPRMPTCTRCLTAAPTAFGVGSDACLRRHASQLTGDQHPADDRVGRQRRLRALLEQAVADVGVRRLYRHQLQRHCQRRTVLGETAEPPVHGAGAFCDRLVPAAATTTSTCGPSVLARSSTSTARPTSVSTLSTRRSTRRQRLVADYGNVGAAAGTPAGWHCARSADQSAWMVQFRVHRNFYP